MLVRLKPGTLVSVFCGKSLIISQATVTYADRFRWEIGIKDLRSPNKRTIRLKLNPKTEVFKRIPENLKGGLIKKPYPDLKTCIFCLPR